MKFILRHRAILLSFFFGFIVGGFLSFVMLPPWLYYRFVDPYTAKGRIARAVWSASPDKIILHEGLPHPHFEAKLFQQEKASKPVNEIEGHFFYQQTLNPSQELREDLRRCIGDSANYAKTESTGRKKCGGFHPDFAVEWMDAGQKYFAMLCFGCGEVKFYGPDGEQYYDIIISNFFKRWMLEHCQQNRPKKDLGTREAP